MRLLNKQPNLVTDYSDVGALDKAKKVYHLSQFTLFGSFINSYYLTKKMTSDP